MVAAERRRTSPPRPMHSTHKGNRDPTSRQQFCSGQFTLARIGHLGPTHVSPAHPQKRAEGLLPGAGVAEGSWRAWTTSNSLFVGEDDQGMRGGLENLHRLSKGPHIGAFAIHTEAGAAVAIDDDGEKAAKGESNLDLTWAPTSEAGSGMADGSWLATFGDCRPGMGIISSRIGIPNPPGDLMDIVSRTTNPCVKYLTTDEIPDPEEYDD